MGPRSADFAKYEQGKVIFNRMSTTTVGPASFRQSERDTLKAFIKACYQDKHIIGGLYQDKMVEFLRNNPTYENRELGARVEGLKNFAPCLAERVGCLKQDLANLSTRRSRFIRLYGGPPVSTGEEDELHREARRVVHCTEHCGCMDNFEKIAHWG